MSDLPILVLHQLGTVEYRHALTLQMKAHAEIVESTTLKGELLAVEHPPVLTLGKHSSQAYLGARLPGLSIVQTDRGGEVTGHELGQLVVYPIFHLPRMQMTPRRLVHLLEESVICTLAQLGIEAGRREGLPGVWVGLEKIASIGLRIRNRVSYHGLALNVNNTLEVFRHIVPCGIESCTMTNIARLRGPVAVADVLSELVAAFSSAFNVTIVENKSRAFV